MLPLRGYDAYLYAYIFMSPLRGYDAYLYAYIFMSPLRCYDAYLYASMIMLPLRGCLHSSKSCNKKNSVTILTKPEGLTLL